MSDDNLELLLKETLDSVVRWLTFAEAKNGLLVAANSALLVGATQLVSAGWWQNANLGLKCSVLIGGVCSTIALVFAMIALLPRTALPWEKSSGLPETEKDSFIFFGHIAKYRRKCPPNPMISLCS
jgi:hypothetical protein